MFEQVGFVQKMKKWKVLASKKQNTECIFGHGTHSSRCVAATVECSVRTLPCSTTVNPWDFSVCQSKKWEKRSNSNAEHGHWSHLCAFEREREREKEREVNVLSMVEANGKRNENGGVFMEWPRVWGSNLVVAESEGSEFYLFYFLIMGQIITAYLMFSLSLSHIYFL